MQMVSAVGYILDAIIAALSPLLLVLMAARRAVPSSLTMSAQGGCQLLSVDTRIFEVMRALS